MALIPVEDEYAQIAAALYGDGAWEIVKAMSEQQRKNVHRANMAGNTLATVGGAHALAVSLEHKSLPTGKLAAKLAPHVAKVPGVAHAGRASGAVKQAIKAHPKLATAAAAGWVGLHGAELASDFSARRALKAQYKSGAPLTSGHGGVHKSLIPVNEKQAKQKAKLIRIGQAAGQAAVQQTKTELKKGFDFTIGGEISKATGDDKRQVFGWASVVELDGKPVVDLQGDYMAIDVIEKAAYDYVHSSRRGGDMHKPGSHASDLIESFIVTDEKKKLLGLPDSAPTGWWVGFQVNDDEVWRKVKAGDYPEFSIHGSGQRVDVEI